MRAHHRISSTALLARERQDKARDAPPGETMAAYQPQPLCTTVHRAAACPRLFAARSRAEIMRCMLPVPPLSRPGHRARFGNRAPRC